MPRRVEEGSSVANDSPGANTVGELKALLVAYARQETIDPIRSLGRYLVFGLTGSVFVGLSALFLSLGVLRVLQTETGSTFDGNLSWIPYVLTFFAVVLGLAIIGLAIKRVRAAQAPRTPRSDTR
jgi:hypothetical protein